MGWSAANDVMVEEGQVTEAEHFATVTAPLIHNAEADNVIKYAVPGSSVRLLHLMHVPSPLLQRSTVEESFQFFLIQVFSDIQLAGLMKCPENINSFHLVEGG